MKTATHKISLSILYLWMMLMLLLPSCSNVKSFFSSKKSTENQEQAELSTKLNIKIDKKSNIKLYKLIDEWYGVPHKDGKCDKSGTDCSCFVRMIVSEVYSKQLPRNSYEMYLSTNRIDTSELVEGDLVFFNTKADKVSHVGVYLRDQQFVHVSTKKGVMISSLTDPYYIKTYYGAGRYN